MISFYLIIQIMQILLIFCLLLSNALSFRRDTAILYSRVGIIILFYCIFLSYNKFLFNNTNNANITNINKLLSL
jgi:hypothetical protein